MNTIQALKSDFIYSDIQELFIFIDGQRLDHLLDSLAPNSQVIDLVPSITWLSEKHERDFTNEAILPPEGETRIAPILVCPDDQDFCVVVVAEVSSSRHQMEWSRLGFDQSPYLNTLVPTIGEKVRWFPNVGPFRFTKAEYQACIDALRLDAAMFQAKSESF